MDNANAVGAMAVASKPIATLPKLNPVTVFDALGSAVRWPVILQLADGRKVSVTEAAALMDCTMVNMSKHLNVLLRAGVVIVEMGKDRRQSLFSIPARFRPSPGVIDYGCCRIDVKQL